MKLSRTAIFVILFSALPAAAEELQFGLNTGLEYNTRVSADNDDRSFQVGPNVSLRGEYERFQYNLDHTSTYEGYGHLERLNDWAHRTYGSGTVSLGPRFSLRVTDSFSVVQTLSSIRDISLDADLVEIEQVTTERVDLLTNSFSANLTGILTPRISSVTQIAHFFRDFDQPLAAQQSISSTTLVQQGTYQIDGFHRVGMGFQYRSRETETGSSEVEDTTTIYQVFGTWDWDIDARTHFRLTAGPAFSEDDPEELELSEFATLPRDPSVLVAPLTCQGVIINQEVFRILSDSCRGIPGQRRLTAAEQASIEARPARVRVFQGETDSGSSVDPFFLLSLTRSFNWGDASLQWTRSDSETQSVGSATILDSVRATVNYRPTRRWTLTTAFRFARRASDIDRDVSRPLIGQTAADVDVLFGQLLAFRVVGTSTIALEQLAENDTYEMQFSARRLVGRYSSLFARLQLRRQESNVSTKLGSGPTTRFSSQTDQLVFRLGFNYRFRPIRL